MVVASEAQIKVLAPVVAYFDRKHREREEKDLRDRRFIASVLELMRAEGLDQTEWTERRRRRMGIRGDTRKSAAGSSLITVGSSSSLKVGEQHHRRRQHQRQQQRRSPRPEGQENAIEGSGDRKKTTIKDDLDPTQAMIRIGRLKPTLARAADPPLVAAELAMLYLVLSDQKGALKSFQLAARPSPKRVPTKEETDEREMQERRLMLLNKDRRAEELAKLEAQEVERERERAVAEHPRRRHAATGIYRCLLELKQPVKAAAAARARLDMCESKEELRQVEIEIHETLLRYDGLIEPAATNQGAWLKESAGALLDLHAAVLESLAEFSMDKIPTASSKRGDTLFCTETTGAEPGTEASAAVARTSRTDVCCGGGDVREKERGGDAGAEGVWEFLRVEGGDKSSASRGAFINGGRGADCGNETVPASGGRRKSSAGFTRDGVATTIDSRRKASIEGQYGRRRRRLRNLGMLLARKRQFTASRQAFDDAMHDGPEEILLRERNKNYSPGFFLDVALEEASPKIGLDLDSRWQGGVEADEDRRRGLADFTGFTGLHRGAETLVTTMPPAGWAGGGGAAEIAYAERLSESRPRVVLLQQQQRKKQGGFSLENGIPRGEATGVAGGVDISRRENAAGAAAAAASTGVSGLMLRHVVPAEDVTCEHEHDRR